MDNILRIKKIIEKTLDDNKAVDIISIDLKNKTSVADYMIGLPHEKSESDVMDSLKVTSISTSLGLVYWTDIISGVLMCIMFIAQIYYLYLKTKKIKES